MATTGIALEISHVVGTGVGAVVGQGTTPEAWVLYSTDDVSVGTPSWTDATAQVRSFSTSRGRESELTEFDAGSATLTLGNRTRTFDPNSNALIKPLNRWWIREQFSGETHDIFKGYAESYDNQWPGGGFDAECVVSCADEFKILALDALPVTNPPRDSYADVVMFDQPIGYWRFNDPDAASNTLEDATGNLQLVATVNYFALPAGGAIVGEADGKALQLTSGMVISTDAPQEGQPGDAQGLGAFTIETWANFSDLSGVNTFALGPLPAAGNRQWWFKWKTDGHLEFQVHTTVSTYTATSASTFPANTWLHIVGILDANIAYLFVNGVLESQVATSGTVINGYSSLAPASAINLDNNLTGGTLLDDMAFYRYNITGARVLAHYQAGAQRGYGQQLAGARIGAVLDTADSIAPRSLQAGVRTVQSRFMNGQDPLSKLREANAAEAVDAAFFTEADGALRFLASDHRSASPYTTSQVTVGDAGGSEIPYLDVNVDYSEAFLYNDWNVTREGGQVQSTSDTTSTGKYFKRSQSLTGLALISDADAATVAAAMLAKYKDPMQRVTDVSFNTVDTSVTEAVFRRELMDKITVKRTPPGGGPRTSQDLFIQKIEVNGTNDGNPWQIKWGVSPL